MITAATVLTCPTYPWCVRHEVDEADGTVLHLSRTIKYEILGSFRLSAATDGGAPAEPTWVISDRLGEWSPGEALALAEQLVVVMREFVALAQA